MKKIFYTTALLMVTFIGAGAQEENYFQTEFSVSGNLMSEYGYVSGGLGGNVKLLLPIRRNNNYITIAANYDRLKVNGFRKYYYNLLTATAGYRKILSNFYLEPQFGLGSFITEDAALTVGMEPSWQKNNLTLSLNYRAALMGFFWGDLIHIFSLKAGFRLSKK